MAGVGDAALVAGSSGGADSPNGSRRERDRSGMVEQITFYANNTRNSLDPSQCEHRLCPCHSLNISLSEKKKAAAPAPEEEMDECEQALAAEPKAKDPFAHVPKSTFVLEEFKSKYSNEDTLSLALPYFWEHFDKDGWSRWYAEYRFPEELTQTFTSCNLMTGMFQRLDKLRKNAFASVILFETNNSSSISGVWAFQGQELAFPLSPDWQVDYEKPKSTRHICVKKHFVSRFSSISCPDFCHVRKS
ncbi:PREDICTED: elongation factor 1-gamma [Myotis davidii]|uniref:elongation factor 1-gamma n=1 Tax=Myotis davidii TaxID=225400 RepID=UPI0007674627|nr:PREDICTED: elongation factor 1-gamma [Myotis davidii]